VVPPAWALARFFPHVGGGVSDVTRVGLRLYLALLPFLRIEVEAADRRCAGARILVANHQSWLDPIVMLSREPRLGGPARRYMFRVPVVASVLRLMDFYEAETGDPAPLARMRAGATTARDVGGGLLFFPEGTRSRTGEIGPFHRGAFRLAVELGLPIQPVVIEGLDRVLPPGSLVARMPGRYPVRVRYLDPIEPPFGDGSRRKDARALAEAVRRRMQEELARMRAARAHASQR